MSNDRKKSDHKITEVAKSVSHSPKESTINTAPTSQQDKNKILNILNNPNSNSGKKDK
jgi:hypothetical protein